MIYNFMKNKKIQDSPFKEKISMDSQIPTQDSLEDENNYIKEK